LHIIVVCTSHIFVVIVNLVITLLASYNLQEQITHYNLQEQIMQMWARNQTCHAERAQDEANFGATGGNHGNHANEGSTVSFRTRTQNVGPGAGDAGYHQRLEQAIQGLYEQDDNEQEQEEEVIVACAEEDNSDTDGNNEEREEEQDGRVEEALLIPA
jgi:hypothetical protein